MIPSNLRKPSTDKSNTDAIRMLLGWQQTFDLLSVVGTKL